MSIEKTWDALNEEQDEELLSLLKSAGLSRLTSNNPLKKIKRNLLINMIWGILICTGYIAIIIYFQIWQVQLSLGLVLLFSSWAMYTSYLQYQKIDIHVASAGSVLSEMKRHHQSISNWMNTQQRVALFIYPVSAAGGFMLGGAVGSGLPVAAFMSKPSVLIILIICIIVLVPLCYYLARWMFNYSFGKHLKALDENISDLEAEK